MLVVGSRSLHHVYKEIAFGKKPYVVIFFFHEVRDEWPIGLHHLQLWFDVKDFVILTIRGGKFGKYGQSKSYSSLVEKIYQGSTGLGSGIVEMQVMKHRLLLRIVEVQFLKSNRLAFRIYWRRYSLYGAVKTNIRVARK